MGYLLENRQSRILLTCDVGFESKKELLKIFDFFNKSNLVSGGESGKSPIFDVTNFKLMQSSDNYEPFILDIINEISHTMTDGFLYSYDGNAIHIITPQESFNINNPTELDLKEYFIDGHQVVKSGFKIFSFF